LAQSLSDIVSSLDAAYAPSRQLIQQQVDALPAAADAQIQGLQGQQSQAFNDITNGARDRGIGFSGIPLSEQAKYTAGTFLPAVANVRASQNSQKTSLLDALNNIGIDQQKTALGVQQQQEQQDFQREQADRAAQAARDAAAASASQLGSLFGGGQQTAPDAYASLGSQKQNAANAIVSLLKTNDPALINNTLTAITKSANNGNLYDKYKLDLINMYKSQSGYGPLLQKALSYMPTGGGGGLSVGVAQPTQRITF